MKSIHLNLSLGFCILIMFTENSFAQENFRTVYPYGGVPDSSRYRSGGSKVPLNFNYSADFRGAVFDSGAYFEEAIFANTADFSGATFHRIADFRGVTFHGIADFRNAKFAGGAHFSRGAIFDSLADFSEATFADEVSFQRAKFANTADFRGTIFDNRTDFKEAIFDSLADFSNANFSNAKIDTTVHFNDVKFNGTADFSGATFHRIAAFRNAKFAGGADFIGVTFNRADFSRANLSKANLSGVNLSGANLSKADLSGVNLNGTIAEFADFSSCFFEPADITDLRIIGAKGLSTIRFKNPKAVIEFRVVLKRSSLRNEERALTSALRKYQLLGVGPYAKFFEKYLLGGKLTDYGAQPWSSLEGLFGVFIIFAFIYFFVPKKANARWGGIVVTWKEGQFQMKSRFWRKWQRLRARWLRHVRIGLYFSLLSSFRIGWRELNVGNWITRLQSLECSLRPTGWVRTISGIQSLISVYLLALWLLTYFGRPFE